MGVILIVSNVPGARFYNTHELPRFKHAYSSYPGLVLSHVGSNPMWRHEGNVARLHKNPSGSGFWFFDNMK